jgi:hypothetical protein
MPDARIESPTASPSHAEVARLQIFIFMPMADAIEGSSVKRRIFRYKRKIRKTVRKVRRLKPQMSAAVAPMMLDERRR